MRRIAIVPARGGSKRLPGKHLRQLAGKPLINHTVDVVRSCFDTVVVSSDDEAILACVPAGANVSKHRRPAHLATDHSTVINTVSYYFDHPDYQGYDQIWLCLPTCPLRSVDDLQSGFAKLLLTVDGVVSVTDYEFPPGLGLIVRDELLTGFDPTHPLARGDSRSQDQPSVFRPNGAFYGMWSERFDTHRNFFRGRIRPHHMPRRRSIDIDCEQDLTMAAVLIESQHQPETRGADAS